MAAASDKARYYLEQSVPELQEFERKGIFTQQEISSIASRRSDFEHTLNARGSQSSDYARYATYEMNLDTLRKKRCKRLGVKSTAFTGQRTIFFLLDRATKKFPGDMGLWMQYINYCQREKANKKLTKIFTNLLRLKPRDYGLWVLAAKHHAEHQGDMSAARSYMQRGLRFCKDEKKLYLEYARLEMVYLAKLAARRKILGLDEHQDAKAAKVDDENEISLDASKGVEEIDEKALETLTSSRILTGAIPLAIFNSAMKQFGDSTEIAAEFFELVASFDNVPCTKDVLRYIMTGMKASHSESADTLICTARFELFGVKVQSADFPAGLGASLAIVKQGQDAVPSKDLPKVWEGSIIMLLPYLEHNDGMDEGVVTVLESSVRRDLRRLRQSESQQIRKANQDAVAALSARLRQRGRDVDADTLERYVAAMDVG